MAHEAYEACRVCGAKCAYLWTGELIGQAVRYFECPACGYVQTETPSWLDRAYAESINLTDTGIMARNLQNVDIVLATLLATGGLHGRVVDLAGGYGVLVRLLRDIGVEALWSDLHTGNLLARGFEFDEHRPGTLSLVTAFEALEHFADPAMELERMFAFSGNVLCSTELTPSPTPAHDEWWYYGREHGQHVGFFRLSTLEFIARKHGRHLVSDGRLYHLFSDRPVSRRYWMLLRRSRSALRWMAARRLHSRTWSDHQQLSKVRRDADRV
jgi:hypothetical protein